MSTATYEEKVQSKWTWNRLRESDRRLLLRFAIHNGAQYITMLENPDKQTWDGLNPSIRTALLAFDWNQAFKAA